jgi:hypothetical protein
VGKIASYGIGSPLTAPFGTGDPVVREGLCPGVGESIAEVDVRGELCPDGDGAPDTTLRWAASYLCLCNSFSSVAERYAVGIVGFFGGGGAQEDPTSGIGEGTLSTDGDETNSDIDLDGGAYSSPAGLTGRGGAYSGGAMEGISSSPSLSSGTPVACWVDAALLRAWLYKRSFSCSALGQAEGGGLGLRLAEAEDEAKGGCGDGEWDDRRSTGVTGVA